MLFDVGNVVESYQVDPAPSWENRSSHDIADYVVQQHRRGRSVVIQGSLEVFPDADGQLPSGWDVVGGVDCVREMMGQGKVEVDDADRAKMVGDAVGIAMGIGGYIADGDLADMGVPIRNFEVEPQHGEGEERDVMAMASVVYYCHFAAAGDCPVSQLVLDLVLFEERLVDLVYSTHR